MDAIIVSGVHAEAWSLRVAAAFLAAAERSAAGRPADPPNCMLNSSPPIEGRIKRQTQAAFDAVHSKHAFARVRQDSLTIAS